MIRIKYFLEFIKAVIMLNKLKTLALVVCLVLFYFAGSIPDDTIENKIIGTMEVEDPIDGRSYLYIRSFIQNNKVGYEVLQFNKPQEVKGGILTTKSYHGGNVAMWISFGIILVVLFIMTIALWGESEGWELDDCWKQALLSLIECELEDGKYHYICDGKLIGTRNFKINHDRILGEFNHFEFHELKTCPKFETKTRRRQKSLQELGI